MFPLCARYKQRKWEQSCSAELKCALGVLSRCSYYSTLFPAFQSAEGCVTERWTFGPLYQSAVQCLELIVFNLGSSLVKLLPERIQCVTVLNQEVALDGGTIAAELDRITTV